MANPGFMEATESKNEIMPKDIRYGDFVTWEKNGFKMKGFAASNAEIPENARGAAAYELKFIFDESSGSSVPNKENRAIEVGEQSIGLNQKVYRYEPSDSFRKAIQDWKNR